MAVSKVSRKWIGKQADINAAKELTTHLGIHPLVARILTTRNCTEIESAEAFLHADRSSLIDPFLMRDMGRTVERIRRALENQERVLVAGDYDVDGVCATTILVKTLRSLGAQVDWFIPSRFIDGYGLHPGVVENAATNRVSLIITVDNGIAAFTAGTRANELGIDLIVTDHHHIGDNLPAAYAIVHPAFPHSMYGFHDLCGAGVAFKLSQALLGRFPEGFLDLVALATVADQVPLVGENRVLVKEGLKLVNHGEPNLGVRALIESAGLQGNRISSTNLAFQIAPRINAVGRLAHAGEAVELLLTGSAKRAMELAHELNLHNNRRKTLQERVEQEALAQIDAHPEWLDERGLVVAGENWHEGVIGIVAGKLTERFHKSTL